MERIAPHEDDRRNDNDAQTPVVKRLRTDWIEPKDWKRIALRFSLDTGEGLRGLPVGQGARQLEVLQGIVAGLEDAEIAKALGIGKRTVQSHIRELFRKMDTNRRDRAISKAWQASLGK